MPVYPSYKNKAYRPAGFYDELVALSARLDYLNKLRDFSPSLTWWRTREHSKKAQTIAALAQLNKAPKEKTAKPLPPAAKAKLANFISTAKNLLFAFGDEDDAYTSGSDLMSYGVSPGAEPIGSPPPHMFASKTPSPFATQPAPVRPAALASTSAAASAPAVAGG